MDRFELGEIDSILWPGSEALESDDAAQSRYPDLLSRPVDGRVPARRRGRRERRRRGQDQRARRGAWPARMDAASRETARWESLWLSSSRSDGDSAMFVRRSCSASSRFIRAHSASLPGAKSECPRAAMVNHISRVAALHSRIAVPLHRLPGDVALS